MEHLESLEPAARLALATEHLTSTLAALQIRYTLDESALRAAVAAAIEDAVKQEVTG